VSCDAVIFVHIPKSAGTTLGRLIEWEYPPMKIFSVDPSFFRWSYHKLTKWPTKRLADMCVFKGHMPFGLHKRLPQPATYITVLRDPIDRGISEYYYALSRVVHPQHKMMKQLSLEAYIRMTPLANVQTKLLAGQNQAYDFLSGECTAEMLEIAKENLATHFSLVGLSERFDESLALAKIMFGWKIRHYAHFNVTKGRPRKATVPREIRDVIADRYKYDVMLYEHAVTLFNRQMAQCGERLLCELDAIRSARALGPVELAWYRGASAVRKAISRINSAR
jgi:hypothetical protein